MDGMKETLKKVLTLLVVFVVLLVVAIILMIILTFILKAAEDITNASTGTVLAAAALLGSLIIGGAIFAKK